jgi:hypothetical protein
MEKLKKCGLGWQWGMGNGAELWQGRKAIGNSVIADDGKIQDRLGTNCEFCDALYKGQANIIVYHRAVQSLAF